MGQEVTVKRYEEPERVGFTGSVEHPDGWVLFWGPGVVVFWAERDPDTGAVVGDPTVGGDVPDRILAMLPMLAAKPPPA